MKHQLKNSYERLKKSNVKCWNRRAWKGPSLLLREARREQKSEAPPRAQIRSI